MVQAALSFDRISMLDDILAGLMKFCVHVRGVITMTSRLSRHVPCKFEIWLLRASFYSVEVPRVLKVRSLCQNLAERTSPSV